MSLLMVGPLILNAFRLCVHFSNCGRFSNGVQDLVLFLNSSDHSRPRLGLPRPCNKLSRGEICVANFIPPANGASLGRFFC